MTTVAPGTVLFGKYRIERTLGRGGIGVVLLAHHIDLDQPVAIKMLRPELLEHHSVVKRFVREAQAAVRLKSEHVCRVLDVGRLESGAPYMVMEYMEGTDLGDLLGDRGRRPPGEAADYVLQACEALAEAHALGIVHRDIKPANLFVTPRADGTPLLKVLDFGISKAPAALASDGNDTELTSTQAVLGTPSYMSPEQMRASKHVDARADVWALGVVLYELVSARKPFRASAFSELCIMVATDPPAPLDVPLPPGFRELVMRCLEKHPNSRFQTVAELSAALAPYAASPALAARVVERTARIAAGGRAGTAGGLTGIAPGGPAVTPGAFGPPARAGAGGAPRMDPRAASPGFPPGMLPGTISAGGRAAASGPSTLGGSTGESRTTEFLVRRPGRRPWLIAVAALAAASALVAGIGLIGDGATPGAADGGAAGAQLSTDAGLANAAADAPDVGTSESGTLSASAGAADAGVDAAAAAGASGRPEAGISEARGAAEQPVTAAEPRPTRSSNRRREPGASRTSDTPGGDQKTSGSRRIDSSGMPIPPARRREQRPGS